MGYVNGENSGTLLASESAGSSVKKLKMSISNEPWILQVLRANRWGITWGSVRHWLHKPNVTVSRPHALTRSLL